MCRIWFGLVTGNRFRTQFSLKNVLLACYCPLIDCTILRNTAIEHSEKLECVHSLLVPKASKWESGFCASVHASVMREVAVIKFTMRVHVAHFLKQVVTVFFYDILMQKYGQIII